MIQTPARKPSNRSRAAMVPLCQNHEVLTRCRQTFINCGPARPGSASCSRRRGRPWGLLPACSRSTGTCAVVGRGSRARTCDLRFWRPPLYQLSYTPSVPASIPKQRQLQAWRAGLRAASCGGSRSSTRCSCSCSCSWPYSLMLATMPAPTVLPPSRMAKRSFSSMAIGTISSTSTVTLSPGITISVPSGSVTTPVTSVVRK
jgi:hypothetical protein